MVVDPILVDTLVAVVLVVFACPIPHSGSWMVGVVPSSPGEGVAIVRAVCFGLLHSSIAIADWETLL